MVVLLFIRQAPDPERLRQWPEGLAADCDGRLVLPALDRQPLAVPVVVDPAGLLAVAAGLPRPNDGGPGIGYAAIDASRTVRYSTLAPSWLDNAFEVATIASAVSSQ